jgi:hypothetical protein
LTERTVVWLAAGNAERPCLEEAEMNLSLTLDVAISLIFVYVLASLLASTVNEMIAGWFRLRGVYLTKAIEEMTSLGKNNQFGWGGLCGWLSAVRQARPAVSANVDKAALAAQLAAEHAAGLVGATAASVAAEVRAAPNFNLLIGLDDTIDDAVAEAGASGQTVLNVVRSIGGIANLQQHPLLVGTPSSLPSYVPARDFAAALLGLLKDGSGDPAFDQARAMIDKLPNGDLKTTLQSFISAGADDIDKLRTRIENWFDDSMGRLSGIYKRFSQWMMLFLGLVIAVCMNIDSVHMVRTLWNEPALSHAIADGASEVVKQNQIFNCLTTPAAGGVTTTPATGAATATTATGVATATPAAGVATATTPCKAPDMSAVLAVIDQQQLPIGWTGITFDFWMMVGWLLSGLAISLGAQFWFGLLTQLISLRAAGDKPQRANAVPLTS